MSSMEEKIEQLMTTVTESKSAVEDQIRSMREEIKKSQEDMAQSVVKQVKRSHTTEFKRKGNEKQYRFNDEVIEKLEATDAELEGTEKEDLMPVEGLPQLTKLGRG